MACKFAPETEFFDQVGDHVPSSEEELEVHPLLLDVILDKVFETLDIQQLLLCRLVCRTWCANSTLKNVIRSGSVVNLRTIFLHTSTTMDSLPNYFRDGDDSSSSIYSCYNFEDICYQNTFISKFFLCIGPSIKSLKLLLNLSQLNIQQFRELIYERLPNLEELNIYNLSFKEVYSKRMFGGGGSSDDDNFSMMKHDNLTKLQLQETRTPIIEFMTDFLETLPNLKEISLKVGICRDWLEQADLWRENSSIATSVSKALLASGAFRTLKIFRCGKLRRSHIQYFLEMGEGGLKLEVLQLHVPNKDSEEIFTEFLNSQRDSLKELILFEQRSARYRKRQGGVQGGNEGFILRLPEVMSKLELLQLSKHYKSMIVPLLPVEFSKQCPQLKRLIFLGQCQSPDVEDEMISQSAPEVQNASKIEEVVLWNRVHHGNTAIVLGSFKNLTKLHVRYPNNEFLSGLWQACVKLRDLTFIFEEGCIVDGGMTGIKEKTIEIWLRHAEAGIFWSFDRFPRYEGVTWENEFESTSIANLKDLRCLKITVEHNENSKRQALGDATAYFAIRWLSQLRYLEMVTSDWCLGLKECLFLSQKCKKLLEMELELTVIHFAPVQDYKQNH